MSPFLIGKFPFCEILYSYFLLGQPLQIEYLRIRRDTQGWAPQEAVGVSEL